MENVVVIDFSQNNECLGLLGPNGAGKSTVMNILTGLTAPSSGFAVIYGHNIITDMEKIHQLIGFCPQFDVLWEELTVEEHILFYIRLKGAVPSTLEKREMDNILKELNIDWGTKTVAVLSGGQKRLLSILLAFVGNSKLILLDEPTTGLDPASQRAVWKLINDKKIGRCVLMTTHDMREGTICGDQSLLTQAADVVCSRIGIMSQGKLVCIDRPKYLKSRFSQGLKLCINCISHSSKEFVTQFLQDKYPQVQLESSFAKILRFVVPSATKTNAETSKEILPKPGEIPAVVRDLIALKKSNHIEEWTIRQCSIEEVFLNLIQEDELND